MIYLLNKVTNTIADIYAANQSSFLNHPSLLSGRSGCELFNFLYLKSENNHSGYEDFSNAVQFIADSSIDCLNNATFCSGKSGINWFFSYLNDAGIVDDTDFAAFCDDHDKLAFESISFLRDGNYDFLHGALGIAHYLLKVKDKNDKYFESFWQLITLLSRKYGIEGVLCNYDLSKARIERDTVNLGFAHGIISLLKFCIECFKKNVCQQETRVIAYNIVDFLITNQNNTGSKTFFPNMFRPDNHLKKNSRLAWCYGDLTIGYTLYQASKAFCDTNILNFANEILYSCASRVIGEQTLIEDAFFCHGSAGVAHIFNKMWSFSKDQAYKKATDYWIHRTLKFGYHNDGVAGFRSYNSDTNMYQNDYTLLNGTAGIGLVLLSYITSQFDWDHCLMLN